MLRIYGHYIWRLIFGRYVAIKAQIEAKPFGKTLYLDLSAREFTFSFADRAISVNVKGVSSYQSATWKHATRRYEFNRHSDDLPQKIKSIALRAKKTCEMGLPVLLNQSELDYLYGSF